MLDASHQVLKRGVRFVDDRSPFRGARLIQYVDRVSAHPRLSQRGGRARHAKGGTRFPLVFRLSKILGVFDDVLLHRMQVRDDIVQRFVFLLELFEQCFDGGPGDGLLQLLELPASLAPPERHLLKDLR